MARIIIVSNRLPITIDRKEGEFVYYPSAGGLATGLNSLDSSIEKIWIGWAGQPVDGEEERQHITRQFEKDRMVPVFLSQEEVEMFYEGFSNKTIWPHFHYFTQYTAYEDEFWESYLTVNARFCNIVAGQLQEGDVVWVHDYQLMLVPGMLRKLFPDLTIGFFLHIPFPSYEIFRTLPWRNEILQGLLGADLLGFHTFGYMRHFLSSAYRIMGLEHQFGKLFHENRSILVDVFPMGIDYEKYAFPTIEGPVSDDVRFIQEYSERRTLILTIDRLDYSKGIPERILAYEQFLKRNPKYKGQVTLFMVVVPSRSNVDQYRALKIEIDKLVGRINGEYGTFNWIPIRNYYRGFPFESLIAMYQAAQIALITPLRDGMNLVAKEYVASKQGDRTGVLILSEMAGAAQEMMEALIVNPNDANDIEDALLQALEMPQEEQKQLLGEMQKRLKTYNVKHWANNFIRQLMETRKLYEDRQTKLLNASRLAELMDHYQKATRRLLLLDYDGTMIGFHPDPNMAMPDEAILGVLKRFQDQEGTTPVIISGRDRYSLGEWLGKTGIDMVSEHGVWYWKENDWVLSEGVIATWKPAVRVILENLVERTPGSFIEEKDFTLAWHYRRIDQEMGVNRVREIREQLIYLTANHNLQVLEGNKVVEIRNAGINKGKAATTWVNRAEWDFVLAIGDDHTDEDTFKAAPDGAYTIKVGMEQSVAKYKVRSVEEARELLTALSEL
jgi:trehalose 6-phosphate synthase/phosphatase